MVCGGIRRPSVASVAATPCAGPAPAPADSPAGASRRAQAPSLNLRLTPRAGSVGPAAARAASRASSRWRRRRTPTRTPRRSSRGSSGTAPVASACLRGASAGRTGSYERAGRIRIDILGVGAGSVTDVAKGRSGAGNHDERLRASYCGRQKQSPCRRSNSFRAAPPARSALVDLQRALHDLLRGRRREVRPGPLVLHDDGDGDPGIVGRRVADEPGVGRAARPRRPRPCRSCRRP